MVDERVSRLHEHLAATAELPLDRTATRWISEAEAVAADCRRIDDPAVVRERVREVAELLSNVESTGHSEADDHVTAAAELAVDVADET